jgi:quinol monooxygenase YgiN
MTLFITRTAFLLALFVIMQTVRSFSGPIALNVKVLVKPERRAEFLKKIQYHAKQTVKTEPGALQFTLGEDTETKNVFHFHEQYKEQKDLDYHQASPHFVKWEEFCATDPFTAETVVNVYQCDHDPTPVTMRSAYCLNVELCIQPELRDEFLKVILNNQKGSRAEPFCLQYDFGESVDTPNSFYFHEQYTGADKGKEGFDAHAIAPHFQIWEKFAATDPFSKPPVVSFYRTMD